MSYSVGRTGKEAVIGRTRTVDHCVYVGCGWSTESHVPGVTLISNWRAVCNKHEGLLQRSILTDGQVETASVAVEILVLE